MNNEYDNGLYGDHIKYFETETAYQTYKHDVKKVRSLPNVAYANTEMIVHYDWDDDIIYDPDEVVLTETSNPTVYTLLYNANFKPSDESKGFTVRDLASITESQIYTKIISEDPGNYTIYGSIFSQYKYTTNYNDNKSNSWSFDEFKYFTGLTQLPPHFFRSCSGLVSITLPHTIETVGYQAFHDCYSLMNVSLLSHPTFDPSALSLFSFNDNGDIDSGENRKSINTTCVIHCSAKVYNYYKNNGQVIDINDVKILWNDKTVYTLAEVKKLTPTGYPIGVNIIGNKYVSLKYMSLSDPQNGSTDYEDIQFGVSTADTTGITFDDSIEQDNGEYSFVKIQSDKIFLVSPLNSNILTSRFKYFNGKEQTEILFEKNENNSNDYPAAACVKQFNPGDTEQGDWYIPAIGECIQIYAYAYIINSICSELITLNYGNIYQEIDLVTYWSSTFYSSVRVYSIGMCSGSVSRLDKDDNYAVLAMLEFPTP